MLYINQLDYAHVPYIPRTSLQGEEYERGQKTTVRSSGCGLCAAVMMVDRLLPNMEFTLEQAVELSSMGIRVDAESMERQCRELGLESRLELPFHKAVLDGSLPLSLGGGIGQSRLCMLLLGKAHIGEVQVSLWPQEMVDNCARKGINLL